MNMMGKKFSTQSFAFASGNSCFTTNAFAAGNSCFTNSRVQKLKNSAKPNSGTVCRFSMEGSCIGFWKSKANSTFCKVVKQKGETFWHRKSHLLCNCLVPKPENSAKPNSRTVSRFPPRYAFSPLIPAVCGFGLGLLRSQGFIGAKAPLDPLCRALWHRAFPVAQSFVLAAFATLVCQRNCGFSLQRHKT